MDEILAGVRQVLHDRDWDLADRIALAAATGMNAVWLTIAYQDLILREAPPTLEEGARMGLPAYVLVRDIRERVANLPRAVQTSIMREQLRASLEGYEAPPMTQTWVSSVYLLRFEKLILGTRTVKCTTRLAIYAARPLLGHASSA